MTISKETLLEVLKKARIMQDARNDAKFVAQEAGKALSTNDYTTEEKTKLSGVENGAQENVIETIKLDGVSQTITGKEVTLDLSDYAKKAEIAATFIYKGNVQSYTSLPITGNRVGDVYNIGQAGGADKDGTPIKAGDNVAYTEEGWDVLSGAVDMSEYYTKEQIDAKTAAETISDAEYVGGKLQATTKGIEINLNNVVLVGDGNALIERTERNVSELRVRYNKETYGVAEFNKIKIEKPRVKDKIYNGKTDVKELKMRGVIAK